MNPFPLPLPAWVSNVAKIAKKLQKIVLNVANVARKNSRHLIPATFNTRDIFYH